MDDHNWKFLPDDKNADSVVATLVNVFWYLDPHRERFKERSIHLPFPQFNGYYDWKAQKKPRPVVKSPELKDQMDELSSILMIPWWNADHVGTFKAKAVQLLDGMAKYYKYLNRNNESNTQRQQNEVTSIDFLFIHQQRWKLHNFQTSLLEKINLSCEIPTCPLENCVLPSVILQWLL